MKALAVIPARAGSKRIPGKNVRSFFGQPMLSYPVRAARESGLFSSVQVSTDSPDVRALALELGCDPAPERPASLADDHATLLDVLAWIGSDLDPEYEAVCLIYATAPFVTAEYLRRSAELFSTHSGRFPVASVARYPVPAQWALITGADGTLMPREPEAVLIRSQDLAETYYETAMFLWFPRERLTSPVSVYPCLPFAVDSEDAIDIDTIKDWHRAERRAASLWRSSCGTTSSS